MYVSTNLCLKIVLYSKLPLFDLINDKKNPLRCFKLVQRPNIFATLHAIFKSTSEIVDKQHFAMLQADFLMIRLV